MLSKNRRCLMKLVAWMTLLIFIITSFVGMPTQVAIAEDSIELTFTIDSLTYSVNGEKKTLDSAPVIYDGRTLLPIKYVAQPLGAEVLWDETDRKVTISLDETKLELWIDKNKALFNGEEIAIDPANPNVTPLIMKDRTMLPMRFVAEKLGCSVDWDEDTRSVAVKKEKKEPEKPEDPEKPGSIIEIDPAFLNDIGVNHDVQLGSNLRFSDAFLSSANRLAVWDNLFLSEWKDLEPGEVRTVQPSESDVELIMRIGNGYNVFDEYASPHALEAAVLDPKKLVENGRIKRSGINEWGDEFASGESIRKYANSMTVNAQIDARYLCFSGSTKVDFEEQSAREAENYFAKASLIAQEYHIYVEPMTDYKEYLTPDARKAINDPNISPQEVFDAFGHYVLLRAISGGKIDYTVHGDREKSTDYENFKLNVKTEANAIFASAGIKFGVGTTKNKEKYTEGRVAKIKIKGGSVPLTAADLSDSEKLLEWRNSLKDSGTIVAFSTKGGDPLIPIWTLADDQARANQLHAAFEELAEHQKTFLKDIPPVEYRYLQFLRIGVNKDKVEAMKYASEDGFELIPVNLNHKTTGAHIYFGTKYADDPEFAFTDMCVTSNPDVIGGDNYIYHYGLGTFYCVDTNLMEGVGMYDFTRGKNVSAAPLYLMVTWDEGSSRAPITDFAVCIGDPEEQYPGWEVVRMAGSSDYAVLNRWRPENSSNFAQIKEEDRVYLVMKRKF